ncbi:hypothetical protein MASR2M78_35060 [Treponema sp.]
MNKKLALLALSCLFLFSCTSLTDTIFLVQKVNAELKSEAITEQGIGEYDRYLKNDDDYTRVTEVRKYFTIALRLDAENQRASQYLSKVEEFKDNFVRGKLIKAQELGAKDKRSQDEDYTLITSLQAALAADPENKDAQRLLKENEELSTSLSAAYLEKSRLAVAKIGETTPPEEKERLEIEAFVYAHRSSLVDPQNSKNTRQRDETKKAVDLNFKDRSDKVAVLIEAGKYNEARAELQGLQAFNKSVDSVFKSEISAPHYKLYYTWAEELEGKKDYVLSREKVEIALKEERTAEALALRKRLVERSKAQDGEANFAVMLPEIDSLIKRGELSAAKNRIDSASRLTKDTSKLEQLLQRRARIHGLLKAVYDKGLAYYRAEDFKGAIRELETVVSIDAEYEQASEYLKKARDKQALVEKYSS